MITNYYQLPYYYHRSYTSYVGVYVILIVQVHAKLRTLMHGQLIATGVILVA